MILPSEKTNDVPDTMASEADLKSSSPHFGESSEYQPESSSISRAIAPPTFPTPFENAPPSYSDDFTNMSPAASQTILSSYYAPASPTTVAAMSIPKAPGGPPVSFSRVPPQDLMYPSFKPMFLVASGKTLDKGFPYASPPSHSNPHPFVSHDVNERDWISFLEEVRTAATLTEKQIQRSHLPIVSMVPIVNLLSSYGVKQVMKSRNTVKVTDCIDTWNRHFFELRKLKVVLIKGQVKVSGQKEHPGGVSTSDYDRKQGNPPSSTGVGQELVGKNDDIYRLFVVSFS